MLFLSGFSESSFFFSSQVPMIAKIFLTSELTLGRFRLSFAIARI